MHSLKIQQLFLILKEAELYVEQPFELEVSKKYLKGKGTELLLEIFQELGGQGTGITLDRLKFDFKIERFVVLYDDDTHFNRYRLSTLKTELYTFFTFPWADSYKRQCRTHERDCLKGGLQERIWNGPPIARKVFGRSEEPGDLTANGSAGWKLNAYNDAQYDLLSRLHGLKLIRISPYENLMLGGSLKKIDDLLLNPKEEHQVAIANWFKRKLV